MAQNSWPSPAYNARAVTDSEFEAMASRWSDDGVYGTPGSARVVTEGTGLNVLVRHDMRASVRGHHWTSGPTSSTLPVGTNVSGQTRIDRVVLRLDRSTWTVRAVISPGTPGSGPPALTQDTGDTGLYEIPLAEVTVLSGAAAVSVTRTELYVGSRVRPCTSTTRNPVPAQGEICYEIDTGRLRLWTGSTWTLVHRPQTSTSIDSPVSSWTNSGASVAERRGDSVTLRLGNFERNSSLAAASDSRLPVLIPVDYRHPTLNHFAPVYISGVRIGNLTIYPNNHADRAGQVWLTQHPDMTAADSVLATTISWTV
ncbi:hypothetical protein ABZZ79_03135 [Streptomyces sp. NPDC006458]|uniref:hypothetical protein n=1 Tax=Streptomyces sp. NPDC006458 TaxID=3154302 RepID=UPI0033B97B3B